MNMKSSLISLGEGFDVDVEPRFELVHADALKFFPELVGELGGDPVKLLKMSNIDPAILGKPDAVFQYRLFVHALELAATQLNSPDFGLRLAVIQGANRALGPIGVVMKNSKTLGQALGYCAKNIHAYSLATRIRFKPNRSKHILFIGLDILLQEASEKSQTIEHALLLANRNVLEITGGEIGARSISFRHAPMGPKSAYSEYFNCEVLFSQEADGIVFTENDLLFQVVRPDEQVYLMAKSYIHTHYPEAVPQIQAKVHSWLSENIESGNCTYEEVAEELCMHPRTLQRRLKAAGRTFKGIKDDVRRETALHFLLRTQLCLAAIAEKLGYADASAFSRCCHRWFGVSPGQLRKQGG